MPQSELLNSLEHNPEFKRSLDNIVAATVQIWAKPQHLNFTGHDSSHASRVINKLDLLTHDCNPPLEPAEKYVLVAAAHLHDIGMQMQIAGKDLDDIRKEHDELGAQWVIDSVRPQSPTQSIGVLTKYADAVAQVIRGHRSKDLSATAFDGKRINSIPIRIRLLSALLQLADELDLEFPRVDLYQAEFNLVPADSLVHWYTHDYVNAVNVVAQDGQIGMEFTFPDSELVVYKQLIADPVQRLIDAKLTGLKPFLRGSNIRFDMLPPLIHYSSTASSLPEGVIEALQQREAARLLQEREDHAVQAVLQGQGLASQHADQIVTAQRLLGDGNLAGAAELYATVADELVRARRYAGAAWASERAGALFRQADLPAQAVLAYARAGQAHLQAGTHVISALGAAKQALEITTALPAQARLAPIHTASIEQPETICAVEAHAVMGRIMILQGSVGVALKLLDSALVHAPKPAPALPQLSLGRERRIAQIYELIARSLSDAHRWDLAEDRLRTGLHELTLPIPRVMLLLVLAEQLLQRGKVDEVSQTVAALKLLSEQIEDITLQTRVLSCRAELADQHGLSTDATALYDSAIVGLQGRNEAAWVGELQTSRTLRQLQNAIEHGAVPETILADEQSRIDATYDLLHPLVRASLLEEAGLASIAEDKYPDALCALNQAREVYQQHGATNALKHVQSRIARLLGQIGRLTEALLISAQLGETNQVEELCVPFAERRELKDHLGGLLEGLRLANTNAAKVGRATAYRALADAIPVQDIPDTFDDLLAMLGRADSLEAGSAVRSTAVQAIGSLGGRFDGNQAPKIANALLDVLLQRTVHATCRAALEALGVVAANQQVYLIIDLQGQVIAKLLEAAASSEAFFSQPAFQGAMRFALAARGLVRQRVIDYIYQQGTTPERVGCLILLGESVAKPQLDSAVTWLLEHMLSSIEVREGKTYITPGAITPTVFRNFGERLGTDNVGRITERFINAISLPHESLGQRGAMLSQLGNLAQWMPDRVVQPTVDLCLQVATDGVPVTEHIASLAQSARDPLSRIHIFQGDTPDIERGLVWLVANLYSRLDPATGGDNRPALLRVLLQKADHDDADVRAIVAQAMGLLTNLNPVAAEEINFVTMALLHDLEPSVRAAAICGVGHAMRARNWFPHSTVLTRITRLGKSDSTRIVRLAMANGLDAFRNTGDQSAWAEIEIMLRADPSFEVRYLANQALAVQHAAGTSNSQSDTALEGAASAGTGEELR